MEVSVVWEQRWHPLREEWVIIAAHRQNRPWTGETVDNAKSELPEYDPTCYLCPGNKRVSGAQNPQYQQTFVFDNDHACVSWAAPAIPQKDTGIYQTSPARGVARVVCYSPKHNLTLAELELPEIITLLKVWQEQYRELGGHPEINHVLIFENKGEVVGVSNPHSHCQIYATNIVFKFIETEARVSRDYFLKTQRPLFQEILKEEKSDGRRVICENDSAIAFMPYFARYAYEVYVAPKETHPSLADLSREELRDFAAVLQQVLIKFDNLWRMPFPYVMPLHQAPTDGRDHGSFHFHIEFHPPLRKPNLLKYLAGPEIGGGNFLSDTSPEEKAEELRSQADAHYKKLSK
ncbi:galactose-1-phosphate uridylyltransferase [candidate division KSB1 bacterium]|nr:MAG: galactose-1-phosphate uridylyltransferase [candidate division KSB1 bacterium]MBC6950082.1 galactose-1-phosphate uridylyltransferase [candidate division KSB1 bacterium]MCE7944979.1 galactose-1-phosphate uridylyltransferase [Chlorobi bacterium CHB1]MDL1874972.1 galactose-1-phosphate uridylyltransferase [Cytophagia bacterium CHB2]